MFNQIFKFELAFHARQPLVHVVSGVLFLLSFGAIVSDNISIGGTITNININSPFNVIVMLDTISFLASMVAGVAFASSPILRDFDHQVAELFFTTRVSKFNYLFGRFCGAMLFCFVVYFAAAFGVLLGEFMPWIDPERLGPLRLDAYWFATWAIAIPNTILVGSMVFLVATLTRSLLASYVVLISVLVLQATVASLVDPDDIQLLSLLDPFGQTAVLELTRYWTPFEMNELVVPMEGNLLYNRYIAVGLIAIFMTLAYRFFPFSMAFGTNQGCLAKWRARRKATKSKQDLAPPVTSSGQVVRKFDLSSQAQQMWSLLRIEFYNIIMGKAFLVLALLGMLQVIISALFGLSSMFGTDVYPTTSALVFIINGSYTLPMVAVMIFYSSELLVRERNVQISEMLDSMPHPNWAIISAKLVALMSVLAVMLLAVILGGILVQVGTGFYDIDIFQYLFGLFAFFQYPVWFTCVLAVFAQVITGNRYLGMFVMVLYFVVSMILPQQGFDHNLYSFATPQIPYSIFTGWGPNLSAFVWFSIYWSLFCLLLLIAVHLIWPRGSDTRGRFRWQRIKPRLTRPVAISAAAIFAAFVASGGFIYYNTNVLNERLSWIDIEERQADYEKAYKQYEDLSFPDLVDMYAEVDIYPTEREAHIEGRYQLYNNDELEISELHFSIPAGVTLTRLDIPNSAMIQADERLGYYIYELKRPMQPGESMEVNFTTDWLTPGFVNSGPTPALLSNGSFFDNTMAFPLPGYNQDAEILDNNRRRRYDLPPAERAASIDDSSKYDQGFGIIRTRANYEAIVSTSSDQIAVTPGYLVKEWEEGDRRYFHYKMDAPIWPFVSYLSGDYDMKAGSWNDVDIEVYYKHEYNVDRMIEASQKSLEYFTENFSPYQYRQYRIFEFPRQRGTFAQSFPNTIPFSEAIGFVADIRDPKTIDYVFYVTAHELAHQWWAHQVIGANVQGSAVLTETLSQYSALMVMEKEYGEAHMQRFLSYELDSYLNSRGAEVLEELPLMLEENQGYIHYRKGSLVLYALKDYLGEDTVNRVLSEFIDEWGFQGPPYPTTRDLIAKFREVAAPEYQSIITDLFEKIVIFDLRADDSFYTVRENGSFDVTLNVSASKFEADGQGEETEVAIDALLDIAVLGEEDPETGVPEVIYVAKERIDQAESQFTINVDRQPVSVGIDPFNKMIDRNPDDNVTRVSIAEE